MEHNRVCLASDEVQDVALERCECGQYSLSIGAVTIQMEEEQLQALTRMLMETLVSGQDLDATAPAPGEIQ
ncbi:MAG: hypothetical protein AB2A00_38315 [Myxococcota bacterium]